MEGPFDDEIAKAINPQESALIDGDGIPSAVDQSGEDDDIEVLSPSSPTTPGHRAEPKVSLSDYESVLSLSASGEITAEGQPEAVVGVGRDGEGGGHVETVVKVKQAAGGPPTSTPLRSEDEARSKEPELPISPVQRHDSNGRSSSSASNERSRVRFRQHEVVPLDPLKLHVPLVGFEVMEERARFTVFKLHVNVGEKDNWFVFRRYTDFTQLQQKLKKLHPMFRLPLPPKRWFRDNYERDFLEERMVGLQAFVDSVLCHSDLCNSLPVQEFFCFNDPPGPHDSVEESRAYCEELEEAMYGLKKIVREKDTEIEILRDELSLYKSQVEMLSTALREHNLNGASTAVFNNLPSPAGSLAECDLTAPEADQSYPSTQNNAKVQAKTLPETEQASGQTSLVQAETKVNVTAPSGLSSAKVNVTVPSGFTVAKTSNGQEKKDNTRRKSAFSKLFSTER